MAELAEIDVARTGPARAGAGVAGCAWALAYVPIHVYWALTGGVWPLSELPESLTDSRWRQANWAASAVIIGAAALSLALVRPWGRRLPRPMLVGVAWVGAAFSVLHWVAFSAATVLNMAGVTDGAVTSFDRYNLFVFEPWFLGMGILLAWAAVQNTRTNRDSARSRPVATRRSPGGRVSAALIVGGSVVVLVGVMAFEAAAYAIAGPGLVGVGVLIRVVAHRRHVGTGLPAHDVASSRAGR